MNSKTFVATLAAALLGVACAHKEPAPPPPATQPAPQPAPPPAQPAPAPAQPAPPPQQAPTAPTHGGGAQPGPTSYGPMPKGAKIPQQQAEQIAVSFAQTAGLPGAYAKYAEFKNSAWMVTLHGPGQQPNTENKMDVVVGNDGRVRSHALIPYGSAGWNQAK